jgi:lipoyl(octanoyl) transferase
VGGASVAEMSVASRGAPVACAFRCIDTPPAPGAWNMGVDRALVESVRAGGAPTLRFYRWQPRCLSLGRHQPARGCYDLARIAERGIDVVRRPTGGRAVMHHRELTYSAVVPVGLLGSPRETYIAINQALVAGLRLLGVPAELQPRTSERAPSPSLAPCFAAPAEGEVVASGRKLIGSAQVRERRVLLQHGSLLLGPGQEELQELLAGTPASPHREPAAERFVTLADFLPELPEWTRLTAALREGWRGTLSSAIVEAGLAAAEVEQATAFAEEFRAVAWTWRS